MNTVERRRPRGTSLTPRQRAMTRADAPVAAALHAAHIGESVFGDLGPRFLETMYDGIATSRHAFALVCESDGKMAGFLCATPDTGRLLRDILVRKLPALTMSALPAVIRSPALLRHVAETFIYSARTRLSAASGELLFAVLLPEFRKKGMAASLVKSMLDTLNAAGVSRVKATVIDGDPGIAAHLGSCGFAPAGDFVFYGKKRRIYCRRTGDGDRDLP